MIKTFLDEFNRYKLIGRKAIEQASDEGLNEVIGPDGNSIAMLVRHISGNLRSRFTDFLTTDGEKSWRDRDGEFETRPYSRTEIDEMWAAGWQVVESEVGRLVDADLDRDVVIRGQSLAVHEALARSVAHVAYHTGQIVLLARMLASAEWKWISIPKGASAEYNRNPTLEKAPK